MWWAAAAIYLERESTCIKPLESECLIFWLFNYTNEVRNMIEQSEQRYFNKLPDKCTH